MYYSAYGDERLREQARAVSAAARDARESWIVFDNTAHGHATDDALRFATMALPDRRAAAKGRARLYGPDSAPPRRKIGAADER
jgi:uncharacterized protein YecE (DUF72 family)